MPLDFQMSHFPFAGSMVESVDAKGLPAPHFVSITNCRTDKDGMLKKRWGFSPVNEAITIPTNYASPATKLFNQKVFPYMEDAVLSDGVSLWASIKIGGFGATFYRGRHDSAVARRVGVGKDITFSVPGVDCAAGESHVLAAFSANKEGVDDTANMFFTLLTLDGTVEADHVPLDTSDEVQWSNVRVVWAPQGGAGLGGHWYVFAVDDGFNLLYGWRIRESDLTVTAMGAVRTALHAARSPYDVAAIPDGFVSVTGDTTPNLQVVTHTITGAIAASNTAIGVPFAGDVLDCAIYVDASQNYHVAYYNPKLTAGLYDVVYVYYTSTTGGPASTLTPFVGIGSAKGSQGSYPSAIGLVEGHVTNSAVVFAVGTQASAADSGGGVTSADVPVMFWRDLNYVTPALGSVTHQEAHVFPASRPWRHERSDNVLITVGFDGFYQQLPGHLTGGAVGNHPRFVDTLAVMELQKDEFDETLQDSHITSIFMVDEGIGTPRSVGEYRLRNVTKSGVPRWQMGGGFGYTKTWTAMALVSPDARFTGEYNHEYSHDVVRLDFLNLERYTEHSFNQLAALSGGCPAIYDGIRAFEFSNLVRPIIVQMTAYADGSGLLGDVGAAVEYGIQIVFEYKLRDGSLVRSPPSIPRDWTVDKLSNPTHNALSVHFRGLPLSNQYSEVDSVAALIYRTTATSAVFKLAATVPLSRHASDYYAVSLVESDAAVTVNRSIYTTGEYEATTLPSCGVMKESVGRLWGNSTERPNIVYFSKLLRQNIAPEFNANSAYVTCPGNVVGVEGMDGRTMFFCDNGVYAVEGRLPNNAGTGGPPDVRRISNMQCNSPFTLLCPEGVWFFDGRSLVLLNRKLQATPAVGRMVEDTMRLYNRILSAELDHRGRCCRWLVYDSENDATKELVYSWANQRWSQNVFAFEDDGGGAIQPVDATLVGDKYAVLTEETYMEETGDQTPEYNDDGFDYGQNFIIGWQRGEGAANLKRFRRAGFVLEQKGTGDLTVTVRYDDQAALFTTHLFADTEVQDGVRVHMKHQKSRSFQIECDVEAQTGDEGIEFSAMTTEVGLRRTVLKHSAARSQ